MPRRDSRTPLVRFGSEAVRQRPRRKTNTEGRQVARIGCLAERNRSTSIESLERSYDVDRIEEPKSPQALNFSQCFAGLFHRLRKPVFGFGIAKSIDSVVHSTEML
jgi:hypothetical protein